MNELVLDASVVLKWFAGEGEAGFSQARTVRGQYEAGGLLVVVPSQMFLEVVNIAGRRWLWEEPQMFLEMVNIAGRRWLWEESQLLELAGALADLGFDIGEPELRSVTAWTARGLSAYDSAYVALAEEHGFT